MVVMGFNPLERKSIMKRRKFIKNTLTITTLSAVGTGITLSPKNHMKSITKNDDLKKAKRLISFHFGTFDLSDEPLNEPALVLEILQKEKKIQIDELKLVKFGEVILV